MGKGKYLTRQTFHKLDDPAGDLSDIVPNILTFMSACYGHTKSGSMSITRQKYDKIR